MVSSDGVTVTDRACEASPVPKMRGSWPLRVLDVNEGLSTRAGLETEVAAPRFQLLLKRIVDERIRRGPYHGVLILRDLFASI